MHAGEKFIFFNTLLGDSCVQLSYLYLTGFNVSRLFNGTNSSIFVVDANLLYKFECNTFHNMWALPTVSHPNFN